MAPAAWNGSDMIYFRVIRPFVLRHQKKVDKALDDVKDVIHEGG